ncbi:MAG: EAL domain-containing protein, partial [Alphaproteobacteria bacterium]
VAYLLGWLAPLEHALMDLRFGLLKRDATRSLVVVEIDARSLQALDVWPWPRTYHAALLDRLVAAGASEIALDIDFSAHSTPAADAALERALERAAGRVILPIFGQSASHGGGSSEYTYTAPIWALREHARLGSVNVIPAADSLIRRHATLDRWGDTLMPTLPGLLAGRAQAPTSVYYIDYGIRPETVPRLSYVDVLRGNFDRDAVAGRKVIVGATAVELGDQFAVPVYRALPGPLMQALAYESLVQGRDLVRSAPVPVLLLTLLLALALGPRFATSSWRHGLMIAAGLIAGASGLAVAVQAFSPLLLDTTPWMLVIQLSYGAGLTRRIDRQAIRLLVQGLRLRRIDTLMRNVVENSFDGIITISEKGVIETANSAAGRIFGFAPGNLPERHVETLVPALAEGVGDLAEYAHRACGVREVIGRRADGSTLPIELAVNSMMVDERRIYVAILRDITEFKAQRERLEHLALHDALTDLPNGSLLNDRIEVAVRAARRTRESFALLLLDLDRFKEINDTLGHPVGDAVLKEVGRRLAASLGDAVTIARLGGDEFAVLLPMATNPGDHARRLAERIVGALQAPFEVDRMSLEVGGSIGIAMFPQHGEDPSRLLRSADVAMYMAKREPGTIALYDPGRDHHSVRSLALKGDLRRAIESDQLVLQYQPQVDLAAGQVIGAEALVRWRHPEHGVVLPDEFIALAEQIGLIRQLTRWVLNTALRQAAAWHRKGFAIAVSVNLSPRNLHEDDLSETIGGLLERYGVEPRHLTLEITESAIMVDPTRALKVIERLSAIGVRLAIDDYGTGYSSLAYLKRLPVDEIKIDKSFVMNMTHDRNDRVIVRSTVDLVHNLGLKVVAEGVACKEQFRRLKAFGCDTGQGHFVSHPLPLADFMVWLEQAPWEPARRSPPAPRLPRNSSYPALGHDAFESLALRRRTV